MPLQHAPPVLLCWSGGYREWYNSVMDLQDLIQTVLVANTLKLSLKQKLCTKDSKFAETLEVWSLPEGRFLCFHYLLVCRIRELRKTNSAYPGRLATTFSEPELLSDVESRGVPGDLMMEKEEFSPSAWEWSLTILQGVEVASHVMNTAGRAAGLPYRWTASCRDFEDLTCEKLVLQSW